MQHCGDNISLFEGISTVERYYQYFGGCSALCKDTIILGGKPWILWMVLITMEGHHWYCWYYLHSTDHISPQYSTPSTVRMVSLHSIEHPPQSCRCPFVILDIGPQQNCTDPGSSKDAFKAAYILCKCLVSKNLAGAKLTYLPFLC